MAKKSAAGKRTGASRRPAAGKDSHVTLVRTPGASTATLNRETDQGTSRPANAQKPGAQPQRTAQSSRATQPVARATATATATTPTKAAPAAGSRPASSSAPSLARTPSAAPAPRASATTTPAARPPAARPTARPTRPSQRSARGVNVVTAEHYAYVKRDLIMIGILAGAMFAILVIVYFYLRSQGQV